MINGVYLSTMGALTEAAHHGVIANNLANSNTAGFKTDYCTFRELLSESMLQPGRRPEINELLEKTGGGVWLNSTQTSFEAGSIRDTGNPLQAAIVQNDGFFQVEKNGEQFLTRDGSFMVSNLGQLVMSDGQTTVLDSAGSPIDLSGVTGSVQIGGDGTIYSEETGAPLATLGLVKADNLVGLKKVGDNLFRVEDSALSQGDVSVLGGHVEDSSVEPVREMVAMIEAARAYQANMKFVTIQDQTLGRTVNTVGSANG